MFICTFNLLNIFIKLEFFIQDHGLMLDILANNLNTLIIMVIRRNNIYLFHSCSMQEVQLIFIIILLLFTFIYF